jgi:uncharacterized protein (DUF885 family)
MIAEGPESGHHVAARLASVRARRRQCGPFRTLALIAKSNLMNRNTISAGRTLGAAAVGLVLTLLHMAPAAAGPVEDLHRMFDEAWERTLLENPTFASSLGDRRYNDRWPDLTLEAIERSHAQDVALLGRIERFDASSLPPAERVNYEIFKRQYRDRVRGHAFRAFLMPIDQRGGVQTADELVEQLRFETVRDYEDWIARLASIGPYVDQTIALLRAGVVERRVQPRIIMERVPDQIAAQLVDDPAQSPFYAPFRDFADAVPAADRERLAAAARAAIADSVVPAYGRLAKYFNETYLPACRDTIGASALPDGAEWYAHLARYYTTLDLTPAEIHELGLKEVARIRAGMEKIIDELDFRGDFQAFLQFMRTDPQFYYEDPQALLEGYRATAKRIDPELVKLFGHLPRTPYGVRPIPDKIAPDTTTAYYQAPAGDGSRAGYYYVNLYRPEVRPKYEMEVLTVHEAVPGHHLQLAIQQELGALPNFRRYDGFTAFVEGWGLYSESLGDELGLYQDPYSKFGQLTYEMWRAVRLVVDTGMHVQGWTRDRAIQFFKENAAKTEADIVNEIDRYIAWPGQALAYKIGELKIKELRARAEERLGERFDIRAFHDTVLGSGSVPLDVLEANVDAWIAAREGATP